MSRNMTLSMTDDVHAALAADARHNAVEPGVYAVRIIEDYLLARTDLLDERTKADILLARSLIDRAVETALRLVEADGFKASITYDAIQAASADPTWLADYRTLVRDAPYKTGNPRKQTINQNIGYFIKKAVRAESATKAGGKPQNVKVKGSIIQSYTPLTPGA